MPKINKSKTPKLETLSVTYVVYIPEGDGGYAQYFVEFAKHQPTDEKYLVTCTNRGFSADSKSVKSKKASKAKAIKIALAKHVALIKNASPVIEDPAEV